MISIQLDNFKQTTDKPFLQTGFRPFFLGAAAYAIWVIAFWTTTYVLGWKVSFYKVAAMQWHAHEMVYGYFLAVIAGFLLTAVRNWTQIQTADGNKLLALFSFWLLGRIPPLTPTLAYIQATADLIFIAFLIYCITIPIVQQKMSRQWPVLVVLSLLLVANMLYYGGLFGLIEQGIHKGIYMGFYIIFMLIMVFSRRLVPNFIRNGVKAEVELRNRKWVDSTLPASIIIYAFSSVFYPQAELIALVSLIIVVLNSIRLRDWYHSGIWSRYLLWSLWGSYALITLGFAFQLLAYFVDISPYVVIHNFAIGGMALVSLSMMTRVSLGHTGRNVLEQKKSIQWIFILLLIGYVFRVLIPMIDISNYRLWLSVGMLAWVSAYGLFLVHFFPILIKTGVKRGL